MRTTANSQPLVSIITPTYNRAALLPRSMESVLSQDFADLELIVVDDGSTDRTPQVVAQFADPRLRYIRFAENRGIGAARHAGVEASQGDLIAFNDSDDVWLPGKLAYQVALFQRHPDVDVIFGDYRNIHMERGTEESGFAQTAQGLQALAVHPLEPEVWAVEVGLPQALLWANFCAAPTIMARGSVFKAVGNFCTDLSSAEDFEFYWRAAVKGAHFAYTTRPLIVRYKDAQSITARTVSFVPRKLKALDCCEATAREVGRLDLIPHINRARHRAWRGLVKEYARAGLRAEALGAFRQAIRYGITPQLLLYGSLALGGARTFALARAARRALVGGIR